MEVLVATIVIGLLAALVAHFGTSRRGRDRSSTFWQPDGQIRRLLTLQTAETPLP